MSETICRICTLPSNDQTDLFEYDGDLWALTETGDMYTSCFHIQVILRLFTQVFRLIYDIILIIFIFR